MSLEFLYLPNYCPIFRFILDSTEKSAWGDRNSTFWNRDHDQNIVSTQVCVIQGFQFNSYVKFVFSYLTVVWKYLERNADILRNSIAHKFKGPVRRGEGDRPLLVEFRQLNTLMKFQINGTSFVNYPFSRLTRFSLSQKITAHP